MIQAIYHRSYNRLTIEGHANSGEPGHDLVCAGVSALAYTLAANVGHMEEGGQVRDTIVKLEPGHAEISCRVNTRYKAIVQTVFQAVIVGVELLAVHNPQYLSFEIRG